MNFSNNLALLIGVGKNKTNSFVPLPVHNDVEALKLALSDPNIGGYQPDSIHCLLDEQATQSAIEDQLIGLAKQAQRQPEATIFIYYSGHGAYDTAGHYYLLNYEATRDFAQTALSAQRLMDLLKQIQSKRVVIVFDCCYAAGLASGKSVDAGFGNPSKDVISTIGQRAGVIVIASSQQHQQSFIGNDGISIFTRAFLTILHGYNAPANATDVLIGHVIDTLPELVSMFAQASHVQQLPEIAFNGQSFSLAKLLGGKGLGAGGWERFQAQANASIEDLIARSQVTNVHIGDIINAQGSRGFIKHARDVQQDFSQHTTVTNGINLHGARFGNNANITGRDSHTSNVSINGSTVNGVITGSNDGTINYNSSPPPPKTLNLNVLDILEKQLNGLMQAYSHDEAFADQLQIITIHLRAAKRNQAQADLQKAREAAANLRTNDPVLNSIIQCLNDL